MSALKRKQATSKPASDSVKKRQKLDQDSHSKSRRSSDTASTKPNAAKSVLSKEQPAFPRGGAGPLTLLEQKQIRAKASRDVAKELENGDLFSAKVTTQDGLSDDSEIELDQAEEKQTFAVKKKSSKKTKKTAAGEETDTVHIESLSHKKLNEDSLLLGRITNVGSRDLTIALPNNLTGFVPLTNISKQFSAKLEKALQEDTDNEGSADEEDLGTELKNHFKTGQLIRVAVRESAESNTRKQESRKRLDLSIEPTVTNSGLSRGVLAVGITIQVAVSSVEDHGLVVDTGLEDGTTGFVPRKALPATMQLSDVQVGSVFLCTITNVGSKGKAVQLSADPAAQSLVKTASSIDAYLPGTLVEILLTQVSEDGLAGKVLGLLDVTADMVHSASYQDKSAFTDKYQVGQKVKGRLIANFPQSERKKLAFSIVHDLVDFNGKAEDRFELSSIIHRAKIICVVPGLGVYFSLPSDAYGFAHISRLSDKTVDSLSEMSGPYKVGSEHEARILDYNPIDGLYILSLQKSILEQLFLRLEDVKVGEVVSVTIEKLLVGETGVRGLLVRIAPGIHGFIQPLHFSDVVLKNPEKKYREGVNVKARVLNVDIGRRRLELTLKKTLVNSDQPIWSGWDSLTAGASAAGTLVKVDANGALVQFYGPIKGRLPVSEMSEAYIKDAREHFKVGQVLTVHILRVDAENHRLTLTARDPSTVSKNDSSALEAGTLVTGTVFEKSADDLSLRLKSTDAIARLPLDHISDGSQNKRKSAHEKIRVGQQMEDVLVLDAQRGRIATLSNKASLRKAAHEGRLLKSFEDLKEDAIYTGFVSNITDSRVFVRFAAGITGVINKSQIPDDQAELPDFGMKTLQPISARVVKIDYSGVTPRFWLSMKTSKASVEQAQTEQGAPDAEKEVHEPVDEHITSYSDLKVGTITKARITSVKETQINVELAKGIQGRVDVSEVFDNIEDIKDRKHPLRQFSAKQILTVRILGQHDSRSYKFLPLSHRTSKNVVFEMSARPSMISGSQPAVLRLENIEVGQSYTVFVNNNAEKSLMVNVSPAVRGRIRASDVSDDLSLAANLPRHFPVGSALKAKVVAVDVEKNRLDLSAKTGASTKVLTIDNISAGDIVAGRITKINDRSLIVQLSESLVGGVELVDMADDYNLADPARFQKNEIIRAYVLQVDKPNKRIYLSIRPSKILSSGLDVNDPELSLQGLSVNDVRRGFVCNVSDKGVFVTLAHGLTAFVRVTNLSDEYIKDWKDHFQKDQLVQGKVISVDKDSGHVQMSLRKSHIEGTYRPKIAFNDLKVDDIVEAKIAKIETFGIFIEVTNSEHVRGLCHRSEIAEKRIEDATKLGFSEGDIVKAKVLKVEPEQRRVNFGMKASYFADEVDEDEGEDEGENSEQDMADEDDDEDISEDEGVDLDFGADKDNETDQDSLDNESEGISIDLDDKPAKPDTPSKGLSVGGFDWFGMPQATNTSTKRSADDLSDVETTVQTKKKQKKRKPEILVDHTADLDIHGPQTPDDFDRLLLTDPANAALWVQYMAHYISQGDTDAARSIGTRALSSIPPSFASEKLIVWVALLNLENAFGDDESVDVVLQRACETMDPEEMHARLASIYIQSGKTQKADTLFQTMLKKFTQNPKLWINYATFLFDTLEDPVRARALLPRALQALPPFAHFDVTSKFAQLEFKTKTGVPEEGRTRFQGLVNLYPKRLDLFNVMLDLEMKLGDKEQVRGVFEQVLSRDLKPAKAKPFFQRWLAFEKKEGDERKAEEVEARAAKWVAKFKKEE
ncbi:rRNA biogenesis protein rrp5 [Neophaeococcomyces mojaviensis]|uniref:rRNA biogenesis protein rrp5 n=1 Tax=Neophaeococcomyces mojaviensis TaxID=3383035 RepID=A0ACC2ZRV9_9EURO|nr:rRNA biogenesis protein rrp5 [Knufia sp. JES_112]